MFHVKYLGCSLYGLGGENIFKFFTMFIRKTNDPRGGVNFDPKVII